MCSSTGTRATIRRSACDSASSCAARASRCWTTPGPSASSRSPGATSSVLGSSGRHGRSRARYAGRRRAIEAGARAARRSAGAPDDVPAAVRRHWTTSRVGARVPVLPVTRSFGLPPGQRPPRWLARGSSPECATGATRGETYRTVAARTPACQPAGSRVGTTVTAQLAVRLRRRVISTISASSARRCARADSAGVKGSSGRSNESTPCHGVATRKANSPGPCRTVGPDKAS